MNPIREDLKAFVDGELSESRMEEVRTAVASDPSLQQEVEELRLLGFEIKRLASEPAVVGKERVLDRVRRPALPWWKDTTRLSGRLAYSFALFACLGLVSAILFPVFAQSKESSKRTAALSEAKQERMRQEMDGGAPATIAPQSPARAPSENGAVLLDDGMGGKGAGMPAPEFQGGAGAAPGDKDESLAYRNADAFAEGASPAPAKSKATGEVEEKRRDTGNWRANTTAPQTTKPQSPSTSSAPPSNRMVIKNASIELKVEDAKKALTEAEALAKSLGGYVEGGNLTSNEGQTPRAQASLRVRSSMYETAMKALRGMGTVLSESSNAQDVTAQHADVSGRLTVLRAEADSYVTMLRGARRIGEIMEIKDRLSQVRQEISSLDAQRKALQNESALSTIHAAFEQKASIEEEKESKDGGFDETWAKAVNGLSRVGEFLGNFAIYLFVFAPVWLPPVLLFWWLSKRAKG